MLNFVNKKMLAQKVLFLRATGGQDGGDINLG